MANTTHDIRYQALRDEGRALFARLGLELEVARMDAGVYTPS